MMHRRGSLPLAAYQPISTRAVDEMLLSSVGRPREKPLLHLHQRKLITGERSSFPTSLPEQIRSR